MNADEIVKELRNCPNCDKCDYQRRYQRCKFGLMRHAAGLIESLTAQLAASQRRADKAVEDMKLAATEAKDGGIGICAICKYFLEDIGMNDICNECAESERSNFKWRGEAEGRDKHGN